MQNWALLPSSSNRTTQSPPEHNPSPRVKRGGTQGTEITGSIPRVGERSQTLPNLCQAPTQLLRASVHGLMGLWGDRDTGGYCLGLAARKGWRVQSAEEELSVQPCAC